MQAAFDATHRWRVLLETTGGAPERAREVLEAFRERRRMSTFRPRPSPGLAAAAKLLEPLLSELARRGFPAEHVSDLRDSGVDYRDVVPLLAEWMPKAAESDRNESFMQPAMWELVHVLNVPWPEARKLAASALIEEYRLTANDQSRSFIGQAVAATATKEHVAQLVELASEPKYGRESIVLALGNMKGCGVEPLLERLLDDANAAVVEGALESLWKLRARVDVAKLGSFLRSKRSKTRKAAVKLKALVEGKPPTARRTRAKPAVPGPIPVTECASIAVSADQLPRLLRIVSEAVESGFGLPEVKAVCAWVDDMEVGAEAAEDFAVQIGSDTFPMRVQVFVDDVDAPDVYFFAPDPLGSNIRAVVERFSGEPNDES